MTRQIFKPTLQKYFKLGGGYARITVGVAILVAIAIFAYDRPIIWSVPFAVVVLLATLIGFHLRSLTISDSEISYKGWFGKRVRLLPGDVSRIILATKYQEFNIGEVQRIFFIKPDGTSHFSLTSAYWTDEALSQLVEWGATHAVSLDKEEDPTNTTTLVAKYGKALPFYERRMGTTALLFVGGIIGLYAVWFVIFELPSY